MRRAILIAALLAAGHAAGIAQPVYRCGNVYAQQPCGEGEALELRDDRSGAQREEALDAQRRHREMADELARDRREFEAQPVGLAGIRSRGETGAEADDEAKPEKPPRHRPSASRRHKLSAGEAAGLKKSSRRKKKR